ncbi:thioredoxin-like protein [Coprinopsis marcescibilis]|uniref:glutathione transferase n=1 Tax=Coprinopsis marcescibilis TaxID=230819 RepID=A0A5C3L760_COPMA|nr:thioredoxin-like protein [Coprinopsis marcescibilis]
MITVHHLNKSRSQRVLWLLEELGVDYTIKKYQRDAGDRAPKELLEVNPLGKSPVITDGDVVLAESGAIIEYIIKQHGNGKGVPDESGYLDNLYFLHYAEGSFMPTAVFKVIFSYIPKHSPWFLRPILSLIFGQLDTRLVQPELQRNIELVEKHLEKSKSPWFAGGPEPTAADYQMMFALSVLLEFENGALAGPKLKAYVEMVKQRPAFKRALEKVRESSE